MSNDELFQPVSEQSNFWDSDKYLFEVVSIERGDPNPKYDTVSNVWIFNVYYDLEGDPVRLTEQGEVCTLRQFISPNMTPNSRGRGIIEAILNRKLVDDEVISKDDLIGGKFFGLLSNEKSKETGKVNPYVRSPEPAVVKPRVRRPSRPVEDVVEDLPF